MLNLIMSPAFKVDPSIDEITGACAMSLVEIDSEWYITPYTAVNTSFVGVLGIPASSNPQPIASTQGVITTGYFKLPVSGAVTMNSPLYIDETTSTFTNTQPSTGYTEPIGMALSSTTGPGYVLARIQIGV